MGKVLTVGGLINLALGRTQVPEAVSWISGLMETRGGKICVAEVLSAEGIKTAGYGISLEIVKGLSAGSDGLEARGHQFLATIHVLAEQNGVSVRISDVDKIEGLKNTLA